MARIDRRSAPRIAVSDCFCNNLDLTSQQEFAEIWRIIVGELPAAMLESHTEMLQLLMDGVISKGTIAKVARMFPEGNSQRSIRH